MAEIVGGAIGAQLNVAPSAVQTYMHDRCLLSMVKLQHPPIIFEPAYPSRGRMGRDRVIRLQVPLSIASIIKLLDGVRRLDEMNPQHCVPTINDNGFILWESRTILRYLVDKYAEDSPLYPKDIKIRSKVNQMLDFDCGIIFPCLRRYIFPVLFSGKSFNELDEEYKMNFETRMKDFTRMIENTKFVAGDNLTIADLSTLGSLLNAEVVGYSFEKFPIIQNWMKSVKEAVPKEIYEECYEKSVKDRREAIKRFSIRYKWGL